MAHNTDPLLSSVNRRQLSKNMQAWLASGAILLGGTPAVANAKSGERRGNAGSSVAHVDSDKQPPKSRRGQAQPHRKHHKHSTSIKRGIKHINPNNLGKPIPKGWPKNGNTAPQMPGQPEQPTQTPNKPGTGEIPITPAPPEQTKADRINEAKRKFNAGENLTCIDNSYWYLSAAGKAVENPVAEFFAMSDGTLKAVVLFADKPRDPQSQPELNAVEVEDVTNVMESRIFSMPGTKNVNVRTDCHQFTLGPDNTHDTYGIYADSAGNLVGGLYTSPYGPPDGGAGWPQDPINNNGSISLQPTKPVPGSVG